MRTVKLLAMEGVFNRYDEAQTPTYLSVKHFRRYIWTQDTQASIFLPNFYLKPRKIENYTGNHSARFTTSVPSDQVTSVSYLPNDGRRYNVVTMSRVH